MYGWGHMAGWGPGWGNTFGFGGFGMIFMALFWIALIVGIIFAIRALSGGHVAVPSVATQPSAPRALDILDERYAKGEVDTEEYEQIKRQLLSKPSS